MVRDTRPGRTRLPKIGKYCLIKFSMLKLTYVFLFDLDTPAPGTYTAMSDFGNYKNFIYCHSSVKKQRR